MEAKGEGRQARAGDGKTPELKRIATEMGQYVATYCGAAGGKPSDFAEEKCHDAALMLREALDRLDREG